MSINRTGSKQLEALTKASTLAVYNENILELVIKEVIEAQHDDDVNERNSLCLYHSLFNYYTLLHMTHRLQLIFYLFSSLSLFISCLSRISFIISILSINCDNSI